MRLIEQLANLQALDTELDADRQRYAEIQSSLQPPASLDSAQAAYDQAMASLEDWRAKRQRRELEVNDHLAKINEQEGLLYSGRIKDPREQVALQHHVDALKRHEETLEESALEALLAVDDARALAASAEETLRAERMAWQEQQGRLMQEREQLIAHARQLKPQRDRVAASIPGPDLKRYEALRKRLGGVAVAPLRQGSCGACGAKLPTALRQQVYGDQLVPCPTCHRLLHD